VRIARRASGPAAAERVRHHEVEGAELRQGVADDLAVDDAGEVGFAGIVHGEVVRYALPQLGALNFVMADALGGGVTPSRS
jgi:hypothetical protein